MGVWTDNFAGDDYNSVSPEERKARREKYLNYMQEYYSPAEIEETLVKSGAYDKEKQAEQSAEAPSGLFDKGRGAIQNQQSMSGQKVFNPNLVDNNAKSQEELVKEALLVAYPSSQEELDKAAQKQLTNPDPFTVGARESVAGTDFLESIPADKRQAAIDAVNRSRSAYEANLKTEGTGGRIVDRSVEGLGALTGNPSTYAMAPVSAAAAGLGTAAKFVTPAILGTAQGAEEIVSQKRQGRDVEVIPTLARNIALAYIPGVASEYAGAAARGSEKAIIRAAEKPAAVAAFQAATFGEGMAHDAVNKVRGADDRSWGQIVSDNGENSAAAAISSLPLTARSHIEAISSRIAKERNLDPSTVSNVMKSYLDVQNELAQKKQMFEVMPTPEMKTPSVVDAKQYRDAMDVLLPHHAATTELQNNTAAKTKNAVYANIAEAFADKNFKAISTLSDWAKKEKTLMFDRMVVEEKSKPENAKGFDEKAYRATLEDQYNKGLIDPPISEQFRKAVIAEPTENQTAIHDANQAVDYVYRGLSTDKSMLLDNYLTMKNLKSIVERKKAQREEELAKAAEDPAQMRLWEKENKQKPAYFLPKGITEEHIDNVINGVESDPANADILDRAKTVWGLYKGMVQKDFTSGKLSEESYNKLMNVQYYVPLVHIAEPHAYRTKELSKKKAGEGETFQYLEDGTVLPIDMNVGKILHNSLVRTRMTELKHERLKTLYDMAESGLYGGLHTGKKLPGEEEIPYRVNGVEKNIIVPDWFKASLEKNGIEGTTAAYEVLGIMTGATPLKKFAVQWNPEFAESNFFRDFGRYYRLLSISVNPKHSVARRALIDNNPALYMTKMFGAMRKVRKNYSQYYDLAMRNNALRGRMTMEYEGDRYASKAGKAKRKVDAFAGWLGSKSEDVMRLSCFKMLMDEGFTPQRAGEITGEFLDYNRKGTATGLMDKIVPFFNVAIQAPRADLKVLKARPADYGMRMGWNLMSYTLLAALGYAMNGGQPEEQTQARDRANTLRFALPGRTEKGAFVQAMIPIDQQDRLPAAVGDMIARSLFGLKPDTERLQSAGLDYVSVPLPGQGGAGWLPPAAKAGLALGGFLTVDPYSKRPISNLPTAVEGNRWKNTDGSETELSRMLAAGLHQIGLSDWQPAAVDYAFKTIFPIGFIQNAANFTASALSGEPNGLKAPFVRKLVRETNPNLPVQAIADEGVKEKNSLNIDRMHDRASRKDITDPKEYIRVMMNEIKATSDPFEKQRLAEEARQGFRDRAMGTTPQMQYYKNKVDPSKYEALDRALKRSGQKGISDQPWVMKQRAREQMYGDSEQ